LCVSRAVSIEIFNYGNCLEKFTHKQTKMAEGKLPIGQKYTELRGLVDKYKHYLHLW
jgi:hypothetical protein